MKIALLGYGTVGGGVHEYCQARSDLEVVRVLVRRERKELGALATTDYSAILSDSEINTVVEVMGGLHPAYEYVSAALNAGKNVITANKALVAAYYEELLSLAKKNGTVFRCTAAVGGGIPWLTNLERCKRLDTITEVSGIMNGTTNFILSRMHGEGADFGDVLAQAQALGYAEADPTADIDGYDIRRKLAISANVAFDVSLDEEAIPTFGIRTITGVDVAAFQGHGFTCKLLARALRTEQSITAYVEPTLVTNNALEVAVGENNNLISYAGENMGRHSFYGQGAGRFPTAGNVVQDCLDIAAGIKNFYTGTALPVIPDGTSMAHPYYVRTAAPDVWLKEKVADTWETGVVTRAINVFEMLAWAKEQLEKGSTVFIAGID